MPETQKHADTSQFERLVVKLRRRQRWVRDDAAEILAFWRQSGKTRRAFARDHGLPEHKLTYWLDKFSHSKINQTEPAPNALSLHPVRLPPAPGFLVPSGSSGTHDIEIVTPDGLKIRLGNGFRANALRRALEVLSC
jgi:hypothetical protein